MTDSIAQASTTSQDEAPFKAFETAFAKRICKIAGVRKLSEFLGQQITSRYEDCGLITRVTRILHLKKNEFDPEAIEFSLENYDQIIIRVRLYNHYFIFKEDEVAVFASGVYSAYKVEEGTDDDTFEFEQSSVGIGLHDRLLVTEGGQIADIEGVTGVAKATG